MQPVRLGVWGVFGRGNFGNEATLTAFLDRLDPEAYRPVLFCEDPKAASALHGIPARSLGRPVDTHSGSRIRRAMSTASNRLRLLSGALRAARSVDAVVVAGTGGLERYGSGAFGTPFEIWALGWGARLSARPFVLLDIGVEKLPRRIARFFVRSAGKAAGYRSYRDESSRSSMVENGLRAAASDPVVTDMAFALRPDRAPMAARPTVVLGVMDYWGRDSSHATSEEVHARYAAECVSLVRELTKRGLSVQLVGGDDGDLEFADGLGPSLEGIPVVEARSPQELVTTMSAAQVVIASRYHTLIMALLAGTPALSIGYADKHRAILAQLDLPYLHRDIETFDASEVADATVALAAGHDAAQARIDRAVHAARDRLNDQWQDVERVLTQRRSAR
ncbi:MAG: polysaccharide pyruvyl transferase family protein [Humibacter sp.]